MPLMSTRRPRAEKTRQVIAHERSRLERTRRAIEQIADGLETLCELYLPSRRSGK